MKNIVQEKYMKWRMQQHKSEKGAEIQMCKKTMEYPYELERKQDSNNKEYWKTHEQGGKMQKIT